MNLQCSNVTYRHTMSKIDDFDPDSMDTGKSMQDKLAIQAWGDTCPYNDCERYSFHYESTLSNDAVMFHLRVWVFDPFMN